MGKYQEDLQNIINKHFVSESIPKDIEALLADIQQKFGAYQQEIKNLKSTNMCGPYEEICQQFNYGRIVYDRINKRIQTFNNQVITQFQYTEEELRSFSLETLLLPNQPAKASTTTKDFLASIQALGTQDHKFFQLRYRRANRSEIWLDTCLVSFPAPNEHLVVLVLRDIDNSKLEEEKNQDLLDKLESVNDELRDFAYVVSHDLKAPLRGILSITKWLGADYKDKFDEEGSEMLKLLETRTSRLQQLIDGVLAYSKVSHGGEEIERIDVKELILGIKDFLAAPEHIEFRIVGTFPVIYFEPTKLGQIFQNLMSNSIKYMDKSKGLIEVGCEDKGENWEFYVSDNGPGIEKTYHDKIFQIFQTLHSRDEVESTGIGLSIVKKIIDKFGGDIWLESVPEEGCTFYFNLPKNIDKVTPNKEYEKWVQSI